MPVFEINTHRTIQNELPEISGWLKEISANLSVMAQVPEFHPKEDPKFCMDFDEWAARLDSSDRRRLMNFLWNDEDWHATCLREEDSTWDDPDKEMHPLAPRSSCDGSNEEPDGFGPSEGELPF